MITLREGVKQGILAYNQWAAEQKEGSYDPISAYGELRGILFNKLLANLKEADEYPRINSKTCYGRHWGYIEHGRRMLQPTDLLCQLSSTCILEKLFIQLPNERVSAPRRIFLVKLHKICSEMGGEIPNTPLEVEVSSIIDEVKSFKV